MDLFPGMALLWFWGWEPCSGLCPSVPGCAGGGGLEMALLSFPSGRSF